MLPVSEVPLTTENMKKPPDDLAEGGITLYKNFLTSQVLPGRKNLWNPSPNLIGPHRTSLHANIHLEASTKTRHFVTLTSTDVTAHQRS